VRKRCRRCTVPGPNPEEIAKVRVAATPHACHVIWALEEEMQTFRVRSASRHPSSGVVEARAAAALNAHDPRAYGDSVGSDYDRLYPPAALDTSATVAALVALAGPSGSILELGIGTGRLALPLVERGLRVAGIEASTAMVDQLRAKPGSSALDVVIGDFATARVGARFGVVVIALNAIFALPDRDAQIECFRNAERHLEPGGYFVVEAYVLRAEQLNGEWSIAPRLVQHDHVELQLALYDAAAGHVERRLVHLHASGVDIVAVRDSYAWPGELDLMARAANLDLVSRAASWTGETFDARSSSHVSVYGRASSPR
jgi:SAM-dependent methyltransferase